MKVRRSIRPLKGPLDVTAMIDVVLLLLIFFMLNSAFVLQPGIEVQPPKGFDTGVRDARYVVHIIGQTPPRIFYNDQITSLKKLDRQFRQLGRRTSDAQVVIRADRAVTHGTVSEVLNTAIRNGLSVIIATEGS